MRADGVHKQVEGLLEPLMSGCAIDRWEAESTEGG